MKVSNVEEFDNFLQSIEHLPITQQYKEFKKVTEMSPGLGLIILYM